MKKLFFTVVICSLGFSSHSIGRAHNTFATHKYVAAKKTQKFAIQPKTLEELEATSGNFEHTSENISKKVERILAIVRMFRRETD